VVAVLLPMAFACGLLLLSGALGLPLAVPCGVASLLLLATRERRASGGHALFVLCAACGFLAYPGLFLLAHVLGSSLGLAPGAPLAAAPPPGPWELAALLLLAPLFEELLYRERLLLRLLPRGRLLALALTSTAFAATHVRPWHVLGAGLAGVVLGLTMLRTRSLPMCVGLHAGLNGYAVLLACHPDHALHALALRGGWAGAVPLWILSLALRRHADGRTPAPR
jgi:membrane protease YdiL (CAAX protease family)